MFDTYDKALKDNPDARPIFHSDRGFQYTSRIFQKRLREQGMEQSMSRVGHCIDNGPTEIVGIIKSEMYCMYKITDEISLRSAIDKYIKFYAEEKTAIPLQNATGSTKRSIISGNPDTISDC